MSSFSTFRSRLILLFALATFPAVALALTLSWHAYVNAKAASEDGWRRTVVAASMQETALLRNASSAVTLLGAVSPNDLTDPICGERLAGFIMAHGHYRAVGLVGPQSILCASGDPTAFERFALAELTAPFSDPERQGSPAVIVNESLTSIAVAAPTRRRDTVVAVIIDKEVIARALAEIVPAQGGTVAVVDKSFGVLAASGSEHDTDQWLPSEPVAAASSSPAIRASSRDGRAFAYRLETVGQGPLSVIAGFPTLAFGPAERQLAIGLVFPFVLFVIVLAVAWVAIDRLFLHWVRRLDSAARRLAFGDLSVRAGLPGDAPLELRQYANAFDQMTDALAARTRELATVAQQRSHLLRELHHRVKNNFQVIASFLNLMKRARVGETREALALAESRVHAMAAAYKLALAQGDIRLVSVSALVQDVVNYVQHAADMVRRNVQVSAEEPTAYLNLDRAIPLALVLVETLWPLVTHPARSGAVIAVRVAKDGERLELVVRSAGQTMVTPEQRFQRAFLQQIEAVALSEPPVDSVLAVSLPVDSG